MAVRAPCFLMTQRISHKITHSRHNWRTYVEVSWNFYFSQSLRKLLKTFQNSLRWPLASIFTTTSNGMNTTVMLKEINFVKDSFYNYSPHSSSVKFTSMVGICHFQMPLEPLLQRNRNYNICNYQQREARAMPMV